MDKRTIIVAVVCLIAGIGIGWLTHSLMLSGPSRVKRVSTPPTAAINDVSIPSPAEATVAVRRHRVPLAPLDHARVTLGTCTPSNLAEVSCAVDLVRDARQQPGRVQHRVVGFSQVGGRWEVTVW